MDGGVGRWSLLGPLSPVQADDEGSQSVRASVSVPSCLPRTDEKTGMFLRDVMRRSWMAPDDATSPNPRKKNAPTKPTSHGRSLAGAVGGVESGPAR